MLDNVQKLMSCELHKEPIKSFLQFWGFAFVASSAKIFSPVLSLNTYCIIICIVTWQTDLKMTGGSSIAYLRPWQGGHCCLHTFCPLSAATCLELLKDSRTNKMQYRDRPFQYCIGSASLDGAFLDEGRSSMRCTPQWVRGAPTSCLSLRSWW